MLRAKILGLITTQPSTCDEAEVHFEMRHQTASARIRELCELGRIEDSGARRPTRSGRDAIVWRKCDSDARVLVAGLTANDLRIALEAVKVAAHGDPSMQVRVLIEWLEGRNALGRGLPKFTGGLAPFVAPQPASDLAALTRGWRSLAGRLDDRALKRGLLGLARVPEGPRADYNARGNAVHQMLRSYAARLGGDFQAEFVRLAKATTAALRDRVAP